ncbi:MAG TPA: DUF3617 family protein [Acidobacteriaceae bacterium]|jgi:hypothetical protein|nr:DUF3617 family protein [Acidobacteriaceae bacterium]
MNLRSAVLATTSLLLATTFLAAAQSAPPIKMGLWEHSVTLDMSGMPNGMGGASHTVSNQTCMSNDTWKEALQSMQSRRQQANAANCSTSNVEQDSHHFAFDVACVAQQGMNTKMHLDMTLDSEESMHGTMSTTMSGPNIPQGMSMKATIQSKFVSSDCGNLKPGQQKSTSPGGAPHP